MMFEDHDCLTVAELVEKLQKLPPDLPILHEGCDCDGYAGGVDMRTSNGGQPIAYITRAGIGK